MSAQKYMSGEVFEWLESRAFSKEAHFAQFESAYVLDWIIRRQYAQGSDLLLYLQTDGHVKRADA